MPSCRSWIEDTIPKALNSKFSWGILNLNLAKRFSHEIKKNLRENNTLQEYGTVGSLWFITEGSQEVMKVPSTDAAHRRWLEMQPDPVVDFIWEQHRMKNYRSIIMDLSLAE